MHVISKHVKFSHMSRNDKLLVLLVSFGLMILDSRAIKPRIMSSFLCSLVLPRIKSSFLCSRVMTLSYTLFDLERTESSIPLVCLQFNKLVKIGDL